MCVYIYIVKTVDKISGTTKSDASSVRLQGLKSPLWIQVSSPGGEQFDLTFSDKDTVLMLKKQLKATQSVPLRMAAIILTNYCNQLNCYSSWDLQSTLYQHCQIFEFGCETWLFTTYHCSYIRWGTWWSTIVFTFRRTQMMRMQLHRYLGGTLIGKTAKGAWGAVCRIHFCEHAFTALTKLSRMILIIPGGYSLDWSFSCSKPWILQWNQGGPWLSCPSSPLKPSIDNMLSAVGHDFCGTLEVADSHATWVAVMRPDQKEFN
jgi:hypothetical protein